MAVRERALGRKRLAGGDQRLAGERSPQRLGGGEEALAPQRAAHELDRLRRQPGEVGERLVAHLAALAVGTAQQESSCQ
jgi:hypothetical protein